MKRTILIALFLAAIGTTAPAEVSEKDILGSSCWIYREYRRNPDLIVAKAQVYFQGLIAGAKIEGLSETVLAQQFALFCNENPFSTVEQAMAEAVKAVREMQAD